MENKNILEYEYNELSKELEESRKKLQENHSELNNLIYMYYSKLEGYLRRMKDRPKHDYLSLAYLADACMYYGTLDAKYEEEANELFHYNRAILAVEGRMI